MPQVSLYHIDGVSDWQTTDPQTAKNVATVYETKQRFSPPNKTRHYHKANEKGYSGFFLVKAMITQKSLFPEVKPPKKQQKLRIITYEHPP